MALTAFLVLQPAAVQRFYESFSWLISPADLFEQVM